MMSETGRQTPETSRIEIPGAPAIEELVFRRFSGAEELRPLSALVARCAHSDPSSALFGEEDVEDLPGIGLQPNAIFAELRGELIAFGRASWYRAFNGENIYRHTIRVRPDWRGRGIGTALLRYLQGILGEIARGHSSDREQFFETHAGEDDVSAHRLKTQGYRPARHILRMERTHLESIPAVDLPAGIQIRAPRPEEITRVLDGLVEAMQDESAAGLPSDEDHQAFFEAVYCQPDLWVVAWDRDKVAGMVLNWIPSEWNERTGHRLGIPDPIAVRRPWRRHGLARALLARSLALLREKGMQAAALQVDSESPNGAPALFAALGFQTKNEWIVYRKPLRTDEDQME